MNRFAGCFITVLILLGAGFVFAQEIIPLKTISEHPLVYDGKEANIKGYVVNIKHIPFTTVRLYEVFDTTEALSVLSVVEGKERKKNAQARFSGKVFYFGGESIVNGTSAFLQEMKSFLIENKLAKNDTKIDQKVKKFVLNISKYLKGKKIVLLMIERQEITKP